jgi:hypothetical protein
MSELSQTKPTQNINTVPIINFPGMGWECGQASSMYTRMAPAKVNVVAQIRPAKVNVVAQIREIIRLMMPPLTLARSYNKKRTG